MYMWWCGILCGMWKSSMIRIWIMTGCPEFLPNTKDVTRVRLIWRLTRRGHYQRWWLAGQLQDIGPYIQLFDFMLHGLVSMQALWRSLVCETNNRMLDSYLWVLVDFRVVKKPSSNCCRWHVVASHRQLFWSENVGKDSVLCYDGRPYLGQLWF